MDRQNVAEISKQALQEENQGKIKVSIITEDGEEFVKGEYEGIAFWGITEVSGSGFTGHEVIRRVNTGQIAQMIKKTCDLTPEILDLMFKGSCVKEA